MAGAAVGVSHLVQASRAGADYGLGLLALVVLACVLKYPFLEFGPRYAAATGESMLAGYRRLGRWALGLYALITVATMFIVLASVTLVTAGLTGLVLGLELGNFRLSALVLTASMLLLATGRYRGLDLTMKLMMAVLAAATLTAMVLAIGHGPVGQWPPLSVTLDRLQTAAGLAFVLALLGWMPIPLDSAAWHSLWTLERARQTGQRPLVAHAVLDFKVGYIGATVMAVAFLILGAMIMHGTGERFPDAAVAFAARLVALYAGSLGEWSRPLLSVAALVAMFSTTLVVTDAFPRVLRALLAIAAGQTTDVGKGPQSRYLAAMALVVGGALLVIGLVGAQFTRLIDFTTTVAFLAAPVLGWMNLKLVTGQHTPEAARPGPALVWLARAGLVFLAGFSLLWLAWRLSG